MIRKQHLLRLVSAIQLARHLPHLPPAAHTLLVSLHVSFTSADISPNLAYPPFPPTIDLIRDLKLKIRTYSEEREKARGFLAERGLKEGDHYTLPSESELFENDWPDAFAYWVSLVADD